MALTLAVLSCFGFALAAPAVTRALRGSAPRLLALLPAGLTLYFASLLPLAAQGEPAAFSTVWVSRLNLNLALRADGLSLLLALLISGVGTLVVIYAGGYLKGHPGLNRFYGWLLAFMGAMLGVALADNLLLLYVFWEITSLTSFMLIGFDHERDVARASALQALLVTGTGGLALLGGLVLLGLASGEWQLSALLAQPGSLAASPLYLPALVLILLGAFTKSAQFPFHFWLPNAMEAPTPVSAYLHSATMVKAGVYLLARLSPVLGGTAAWTWLVAGAGGITMLLGAYLALSQTDLKRVLAYSTVSALGLMTFLIGLGSDHALEAAVVFLLSHALYKGTLFLVTGILDHETGTREVTRLGGLFRAMPIAGTAAALAALSFAGVPPLIGFISKELAYEAALELGPLLTAAVVATGIGYVFVAGVTGFGPFWGRRTETPKPAHEGPLSLWLGPVLLSTLALVWGVLPGLVSGPLLEPAVSAVLGHEAHLELALWHGFSPALILSLATLVAGGALFAGRNWVRRATGRPAWPWGPAWAYGQALAGLNRLALAQTRLLQNGYLRHYLTVIILTTTGLAGYTLISQGGLQWPVRGPELRFYEVVLAGLILFGAWIAITTHSRLGAVAALGTTGYGVALIFLLFGAPDLAMTQFLVESLTVILFVLVFYHLPHFAQLSTRRARLRDAAVALLAGGLMTTLVLTAAGTDWFPSIATYFARQSVPEAHGRNVVNVILVDFRGFDTLGEITVLGVAAAGVYALLKLRKDRSP